MTGAIGALLLLSVGAKGDVEDSNLRAGAWDRSVALQVAGDLPGAEAVMIRGWGRTPDNYWVLLRLAYLALLSERADEAAERYRSLRARPEAEDDPDVVRGHASALAARGWNLAKDGAITDARRRFRQALAIDPSNASASQGLSQVAPAPWLTPALWGGYFAQTLGATRYRGWALYGTLPAHIGDVLVVRLTGRYLAASPVSGRSPWAFGREASSSWALDEQYVSLLRERRILGGEVVGVRSHMTGRTILGGGGRLRVGDAWGGMVEAAYLRARGLGTNLQLRPSLFYWPLPMLGLQAGARLTKDDRGNSASAAAGLSLLLGPVAIHLGGHLWAERWAFDFAGPSLASFESEASYGGNVTLRWSVEKSLQLAMQVEGERLRDAGALGEYWCASAGVQYRFGAE